MYERDIPKVGEAYVDSSKWKEYSFGVDAEGLKVISVTFINDGGNVWKHEDRNLYIGQVRIEHEG